MGWPRGWTQLDAEVEVEAEDLVWKLFAQVEGDTPKLVEPKTVESRPARCKILGNGQVPLQAAVAWVMLSRGFKNEAYTTTLALSGK